MTTILKTNWKVEKQRKMLANDYSFFFLYNNNFHREKMKEYKGIQENQPTKTPVLKDGDQLSKMLPME